MQNNQCCSHARRLTSSRQGFSLVELLVVIAIVAVLASLLFPVFLTARGSARQASCSSILKQNGLAFSMYNQDNDGYYPYAVDAVDRFGSPSPWGDSDSARARVAAMPMLHQALQPYTQSPFMFHCPSDTGYDQDDFSNSTLNTRPSSYERFGTSYYYRTEIAMAHISETMIATPDKINVLCDPVGFWHGSLFPLTPRYNVLFADGHIKSLNRDQIREAWNTPVTAQMAQPGT